jgi:hypothetical protein
MQPDPVGEVVQATFQELGGAPPESITRSVLLDKKTFAGFQFHCGGLRAVWLAESEIVKFYDAGGKLLRKVSMVDERAKGAA